MSNVRSAIEIKREVFYKLMGYPEGTVMKVRNRKNVIAEEWRGKLVEIKGMSMNGIDGHRWYLCERLDSWRPDEWNTGWLSEVHLIYVVKENELF